MDIPVRPWGLRNTTATSETAARPMVSVPRVLLPALFLLSFGLALAHLGSAALWDDEAFVAFTARNLVLHGRLTEWDGRNLWAPQDGAYMSPGLRNLNPPGDIVLAAAGFRLFGLHLWACRLPFVLVGLCGALLFLILLRRLFPHNCTLLIFAALLLLLSPTFLLNIRNCRYYALALLCSQVCLLCYYRAIEKGQFRDFLGTALGAILLFYTHYLVCAAFMGSLVTLLLLCHSRHLGRAGWTKAVLAGMLFLAATVPYALLTRAWNYNAVSHQGTWLARHGVLLWWNLRDVNLLGCFPWMIAVLTLVVLARAERATPEALAARQLLLLAFAYVVFLALLSGQPPSQTRIADLRYLFPVVPLLMGAAAWCLTQVQRRWPLVAVLLCGLLVTSNLLALLPRSWQIWFPQTAQFQWLLPAYAEEVLHPYPTSSQIVGQYLTQHARQDDLVMTAPVYFAYPLMFSVGDRVKICDQLDHASPLPEAVVQRLHAPLYIDENFPDWLVFYGVQPGDREMLRYFSRPHLERGKLVRRTYALAAVLPVYWAQTQRPELPWHHFGPVTRFDMNTEAVYVFHAGPSLAAR